MRLVAADTLGEESTSSRSRLLGLSASSGGNRASSQGAYTVESSSRTNPACSAVSSTATRSWNPSTTLMPTSGRQKRFPVGHAAVTLGVHPQISTSLRWQRVQAAQTAFRVDRHVLLAYSSSAHVEHG